MNQKKVVNLLERKVISYQGKLLEVRANVLGTLILAEKCNSVNLYRLDIDNCALTKIN